jgi:hypothetical protein
MEIFLWKSHIFCPLSQTVVIKMSDGFTGSIAHLKSFFNSCLSDRQPPDIH